MKILHQINDWLDSRLDRLREEEEKIKGYKLPPVSATGSKADWKNFYKTLPVIPRHLRSK